MFCKIPDPLKVKRELLQYNKINKIILKYLFFLNELISENKGKRIRRTKPKLPVPNGLVILENSILNCLPN